MMEFLILKEHLVVAKKEWPGKVSFEVNSWS